MKQAGVDVIYYGVESPQSNVLEYDRKTVTAERAQKAISDAKSAGLLVLTSYIVGAPVESRADMDRTVEFILRTRPHAVQINILDVLIGTEIWDRLEQQGAIRPDHWKTNHRIYEYSLNQMTRSELEHVVNQGYSAHIIAWKSGKGLVELLHTLYANKTARRIVMGNIMNPSVRNRISDARRFVDHEPDEVQSKAARQLVPTGDAGSPRETR